MALRNIHSFGNVFDLESLPEAVLNGSKAPPAPALTSAIVDDDSNLSIKQRMRELEIDLIRRALHKTNGNRTHAARILELSHRALLYKLKEYGLGSAE